MIFQSTSKKLFATNNTRLEIKNKTQASISNNGFCLKNFFVVTNDINHIVILGTTFIYMITTYKLVMKALFKKLMVQNFFSIPGKTKNQKS